MNNGPIHEQVVFEHFGAAMYWPVGVPRIYSAGPSIAIEEDAPDEPKSQHDEEGQDDPNETSAQTHTSPKGSDHERDTDKDIIGLQVSRHGHIFATITGTSLAIWQARVSNGL